MCGNKKGISDLFEAISLVPQKLNVVDMILYQKVASSIYDNLCNFSHYTHKLTESKKDELEEDAIEEIKVSAI